MIFLSALLFLSVNLFAFDSIQLKKTIPAPAVVKSSALSGIAVDGAGRLWVTDPANDQVHLYSADGDYIQSIGHGDRRWENFPRRMASP